MNNKILGTKFEQRVCKLLKDKGYWVHFLAPGTKNGSQPFDIIAVKDGLAVAIECKTLSTSHKFFPIERLEDNQVSAFEYWLKCGNTMPLIFVEYGDDIKVIEWSDLKRRKKVPMHE